MTDSFLIVGAGEALFDIIRSTSVLGGAPLNVAVHAQQLSARLRGRAAVVSRIGQDDLGRRLIAELTGFSVDTSAIQTDPDKKTGRVFVHFDEQQKPSYEIVQDVAWDWIQYDPDLDDLARRCDAIAFGSLAQRNTQSRFALHRLLDTAKQAVRLFDVNLRQSYYSREVLETSIALSTAVKLNTSELPIVCQLLLPALAGDATQEQMCLALLKKYKPTLKHLILTRGEKGTLIMTPSSVIEGVPAPCNKAPNADDVGAGDSCSAAILIGLVQRWPLQKTVDLANKVGAFVASQPGATPTLPEDLINQFVD